MMSKRKSNDRENRIEREGSSVSLFNVVCP